MDSLNIIKQAYLHKQSRILKAWRKRWGVLTDTHFYTFKNQREYISPTQVIDFKDIIKVEQCQQILRRPYSFRIIQSDCTFNFYCGSNAQKNSWISKISNQMTKNTNK